MKKVKIENDSFVNGEAWGKISMGISVFLAGRKFIELEIGSSSAVCGDFDEKELWLTLLAVYAAAQIVFHNEKIENFDYSKDCWKYRGLLESRNDYQEKLLIPEGIKINGCFESFYDLRNYTNFLITEISDLKEVIVDIKKSIGLRKECQVSWVEFLNLLKPHESLFAETLILLKQKLVECQRLIKHQIAINQAPKPSIR